MNDFLKHTLTVIATFCLAAGVGCAGARSVVPTSIKADQAPAFIDAHHEEFDACYSGPSHSPTSILLDVKNDGVRLTGKGWQPVASRTELNRMVGALRSNYRYWGIAAQGPQISAIQSVDGKTIGYLYSPLDYTFVNRTAPDTYIVHEITDLEIREQADPRIKGAGG